MGDLGAWAKSWMIEGAVEKDGLRRKIVLWRAKKMLEKLEGKKTYLVAAIAGILALVEPISTLLGHPVQVPESVYAVLAALGLGTLRAGVGKSNNQN